MVKSKKQEGNMHKIWQIIKTEFKIEFAYPLTWVFFLALPILFTVVIGAALGGSNTSTDSGATKDNRPLLVIIDKDDTTLSENFFQNLVEANKVRVIKLASYDDLTEEMSESANGYLNIDPGFGKAMLNNTEFSLKFDTATESFTSIAMENAFRSAIDHTNAALMAFRASILIQHEGNSDPQIDEEGYFGQHFEQANTLIETQPMFNLVVEETQLNEKANQAMIGFNQSSSGQLVTWSLITLLGGSIIFVRDRREGSYQRMFTTPTSKVIYFTGKVIARMLMGLIQMVILVFFGIYILKVNWGNAPLLLLGFLTCFSFAGTSLGLMLGSFCKTVKQADSLTTLFSMLMAALGGAWWPLEITPASYQTIVRAIPSTWAMLGFNDIIIKNQGLSGVLLEGGVLIGFGAFFMTIGILRLRRKE
jgi:ABC-2 type transport system permease protein